MQADLLSATALGVKNILAVTGDPAQIGDYPEATSVFDTDAIGLVHVLSKMNKGEDLGGNPIGKTAGLPDRDGLQPDRRGTSTRR